MPFKHTIDESLGCPSRHNRQIYCYRCNEDKEAWFEEDLPDRCFADWAEEATNNFHAATLAPDGRSARYTAYREIAKAANIRGIRRPWPACLIKRIEKQFGKSTTGYKGTLNSCPCRTCQRVRDHDLTDDEQACFNRVDKLCDQAQ